MKQTLTTMTTASATLLLHHHLAKRFASWAHEERLMPLENIGFHTLEEAAATCLVIGVILPDSKAAKDSKPTIHVIGGMAGFRIASWLSQQGRHVTLRLLLSRPTQSEIDDGLVNRLADRLADGEISAQLVTMVWRHPGPAALALMEQLSERASKALMGRRRATADSASKLTGRPRHVFARRQTKGSGPTVLDRLLGRYGA